MNHKPPFKLLYELAQKEVEVTFKALSQANAQVKSAEEQLVMLQHYRHDYVVQLQKDMQDGILASRCQNKQRFILTLDGAIGQQNAVLGQYRGRVDEAREAWTQARRKEASMQALMKRDHSRIELAASRREQKANDEYAARAFRRLQAA